MIATSSIAVSITEIVGGGADTVFTNTSYVLAAGVEVETLRIRPPAGTVDIDLTGNELANRLIGNNGVNVIDGGDGDDDISGLGGFDILSGGVGDDYLKGNSDDDVLNGGTGNDLLNGGGGVNGGDDTFVFSLNFGNDRISGFDSNAADGQDLIDLVELGITAANFDTEVAITGVGNQTFIQIGSNSIQLINVNVGSIDQTDFLFG